MHPVNGIFRTFLASFLTIFGSNMEEKVKVAYILGRFENATFFKICLEHVDLAVIHKKWP